MIDFIQQRQTMAARNRSLRLRYGEQVVGWQQVRLGVPESG
jgi:hypothetical protein